MFPSSALSSLSPVGLLVVKRKPGWSCLHDPAGPSVIACSSKPSRERKECIEAAVLVAAAISVVAVAFTCAGSAPAADGASAANTTLQLLVMPAAEGWL